MRAEHIRTELDLVDDARLLAAVPAVVRYASAFAGLAAEVAEHFVTTAEQACRDAFDLANGREAPLHFVVESFSDRVEVQIDSSSACSGGAEIPADLRDSQRKSFIDCLDWRVRAGHLRLKLTKRI